jgi:hypothetical protein
MEGPQIVPVPVPDDGNSKFISHDKLHTDRANTNFSGAVNEKSNKQTAPASPSLSTIETVTEKPTVELLSQATSQAREPLPELPYSLRTRKRAIAISWSLLLLDACFLPVGLFYILKFGAKLDDTRSK